VGSERLERAGLDEITADRERGASELARRCLALLAQHARRAPAADADALHAAARAYAHALQGARPSMIPIQNLLERWLASLDAMPRNLEGARSYLESQAHLLIERSRRAVTQAAEHAVALLAPESTLITHSLSSTIREVFRLAAPKGVRAIVTESRPRCEGRALAEHLSTLGVATEYLTDAQMGAFVGQADLAIVGADTVLYDGSAVNKAGTRLLALAARDVGVPFYVCYESPKLCRALPHEVPLEEMAPAELGAPGLAHVTPRNVYFEVTPARLITGWITEHGVCVEWGRTP
jgi:ribose 1,5-bisphosphate isomerase